MSYIKILFLLVFTATFSMAGSNESAEINRLEVGIYHFGTLNPLSQKIECLLYIKRMDDGKNKIIFSLTWVPGVELQFEGVAVLKKNEWMVKFEDDNFGNSGFLKMTQISANKVEITLIGEKKKDARALRQYGDYTVDRK